MADDYYTTGGRRGAVRAAAAAKAASDRQQVRNLAAATGRTEREAREALNRVHLSWDAQSGLNVIGRAIAAGVIRQDDRWAETQRCASDPGYQRALEQRIAGAGGYSALTPAPDVSSAGTPGHFSDGKVSAMHRNPLVAAAMRDRPNRIAARATDPVPTLFASGDLPPFTASGIDPNVLLQVPWQARHPVAAAATQAQAYELLQQYSGAEAVTAAAIDFDRLDENRAYAQRVEQWQIDSMPEDQAYDDLFAEDDAARLTKLKAVNASYGAAQARRERPQQFPERTRPR